MLQGKLRVETFASQQSPRAPAVRASENGGMSGPRRTYSQDRYVMSHAYVPTFCYLLRSVPKQWDRMHDSSARHRTSGSMKWDALKQQVHGIC